MLEWRIGLWEGGREVRRMRGRRGVGYRYRSRVGLAGWGQGCGGGDCGGERGAG